MGDIKVIKGSIRDSDAIFKIRSSARESNYPSFLGNDALKSFRVQNNPSSENLKRWSKKYSDYLKDNNFILKVAYENKICVGWYLARIEIGNIHLMSLFVDQEKQGKGIGKVLLNDLIHNSRHKTVTLAVLQPNISAIAFYQKFGFTEVKKLKGKYLGVERIIMKRVPKD